MPYAILSVVPTQNVVVAGIAAVLGLLVGWAIYSRIKWLKAAPQRKATAERNWFIQTLKQVTETLTNHLEWDNSSGSGYSCKDANGAYLSCWVDLGLATPGNDGWQIKVNPSEGLAMDILTPDDEQRFIALVVKFGRKETDGNYTVWVRREHSDGSESILPSELKSRPVEYLPVIV